jgi:pyridoxine kinase
MNVLSLQSQVVFGHVGNSAAVFALQRVGCEVWAVPTVHLSNHPGYGAARGGAAEPSRLVALVEGLAELGALARCDGVVTGYLPSQALGEAVLSAVWTAKRAAPGAVWLCDPVIGDEGRVYARAEVPEFFRDVAIPAADVVTPNRFELEWLTGLVASDLTSARAALAALLARGPSLALCTSFDRETPDDALDVLALSSDGFWRMRTPRLGRRFEGAGDLFAALFLAAWLEKRDVAEALARAGGATYATLLETQDAGGRELALVAAQDRMAAAFRAGEATTQRIG